MAGFWQALPFWTFAPNYTALTVEPGDLVSATLSDADRELTVGYACTEKTGAVVTNATAQLRLPAGQYEVRFVRPADAQTLSSQVIRAQGIHRPQTIALPLFTDDVAIVVARQQAGEQRPMPGTQ